MPQNFYFATHFKQSLNDHRNHNQPSTPFDIETPLAVSYTFRLHLIIIEEFLAVKHT